MTIYFIRDLIYIIDSNGKFWLMDDDGEFNKSIFNLPKEVHYYSDIYRVKLL